MKQELDSAVLPRDFLEDMQSLLGDEYEQFLASYSDEKKQALRINTLKSDYDTVSKEFALSPVPWCKDSYYYDENERPGKSVLHESGAFYIQEPSASAVVENLGVKAGETILDLCAAPGGKSTQIAAKMLLSTPFVVDKTYSPAMDDLIKNGDNVLVKASKYMKLPVVIEALKER